MSTRKVIAALKAPDFPAVIAGRFVRTCASWRKDGKLIVTGYNTGELRLWDPAAGKHLRTLHRLNRGGVRGVVENVDSVQTLLWSADGKHIFSICPRGVTVWDTDRGVELRTLPGIYQRGLFNNSTLSPDGKLLACSRGIFRVDVTTDMQMFLGHTKPITCVAIDPSGRLIVAACADGTRMWDVRIGQEVFFVPAAQGKVLAAAFSPDGRCIAFGQEDGTVKVRDTAGGKEVLSFKGHTDAVYGVAWGPDARLIVSASWDGTLKIHNDTGKEIKVLKGHENRVLCVAFSRDGKHVVSGGLDKTVRVWNVETGLEVQVLKGHTGAVLSVAFSPDGKQVVSGSGDPLRLADPGQVKVWNSGSGKDALLTFVEKAAVLGVAFNHDGRRILSGSHTQLRILEAKEGQQALLLFTTELPRVQSNEIGMLDPYFSRIQRHENGIYSATWSQDGSRIVSGGGDGSVCVWLSETDVKPKKDAKAPR